MSLEEYEIWKKEQEIIRLSKKKDSGPPPIATINYYMSGQHKKVSL